MQSHELLLFFFDTNSSFHGSMLASQALHRSTIVASIGCSLSKSVETLIRRSFKCSAGHLNGKENPGLRPVEFKPVSNVFYLSH
jgi:hypothetical protein